VLYGMSSSVMVCDPVLWYVIECVVQDSLLWCVCDRMLFE